MTDRGLAFPLKQNGATEFQFTDVRYKEPIFADSGVFPSAPVRTEDAAEVVVDVTTDTILWRRHGQEHRVGSDQDLGAQLRETEDISASAMVMLRFSIDMSYDRAKAVMQSLSRAGFSIALGKSGARRN